MAKNRYRRPKDCIDRAHTKQRAIPNKRHSTIHMVYRRERDSAEMKLLGILPRFERVFEQRLRAAGPRKRKWHYWDIYLEVYDEVYRGMDEE